jgi:inosine-uridine nucleoside N-ribohydrolase
MPVRVWRTGEVPVPPLPLAPSSAPPLGAARLWIDTDAACGAGSRVDPDDCFALLLLLQSRATIAGVSTVAGNAPQPVVEGTLAGLLAASGSATVVGGAATLRAALERGPLTILALGPLGNIAAALRGRQELARNVTRLVAVLGRREGHLFHPSEGHGHGMLFGHGPVFRDFNYAKDRRAAQEVLRLGVPVTFIPYEAARDIVLTRADLDVLARADGAAAWVAARSRAWLEYWQDDVGIDGFYPFDLVAAAYLERPQLFDCAEVQAWIGAPPTPLGWLGFGDSLFVGLAREVPEDARVTRTVTYCPRVRAGLHDAVITLLSRQNQTGSPPSRGRR